MLLAQAAAPGNMFTTIGIGVAIYVIVLVLMLALFARLYKKCPPNQVLVRSGQGGMKKVTSTGIFVIPVLHQHAHLTLDLLAAEVRCDRVTLADGNVADVVVSSSVAIGTEEKVLNNAAIRLLGLSRDKIKQQAKQVIAGPLRDLLGELEERDLRKNHAAFQERLSHLVERKLNEIGLVLINANIRDLTIPA